MIFRHSFRFLGFVLFCLFFSCKEEVSDVKSSSNTNLQNSGDELEIETKEVNFMVNRYPYEDLIDSLISTYPSPVSKIQLVEVSCNNLNEEFLSLYQKDQLVRNEGIGNMRTIDHENLQLFVSLTENCGFPKGNQFRDFRSYIGIFLILQHSDAAWIAHYYNDFKSLIDQEALPKNFLALIQDRFLLLNNQPQIYGTQIQDGKLYQLVDPENVRQRRWQMGFKESLEVYLSRQGLNMKLEIKRLSTEGQNF